ncbi:MAG TPA: hypothetical protein VE591_07355, partial [Candidatus Acidoferrum sp.]|nr:hypothetical protein [Candidatus Acidoferrum sp.]
MRRDHLAALAASVLVAGGVAAGFATIGSPQHARLAALDRQRIDDLVAIAEILRARYRDGLPVRLPPDLGAVRADGSNATRDPATNAPYTYARETRSRYRLCATFATSSIATRWEGVRAHPAGRACF